MSRIARLPIQTDRLCLRPLVAADAPDLFGVYGDARAMRYWSTPPHAGLATTKALINRITETSNDPPLYLAIERDGRAIGTVGLHTEAEIGFILHADHWRQGLAFEAVSAIIPFIFAQTGAPALTADADPRNIASVSLLEKLGFDVVGTAERTFCVEGEWSDSVYLSLPNPDHIPPSPLP